MKVAVGVEMQVSKPLKEFLEDETLLSLCDFTGGGVFHLNLLLNPTTIKSCMTEGNYDVVRVGIERLLQRNYGEWKGEVERLSFLAEPRPYMLNLRF